MPDAQGTASFIGEFLKGYMGETARREQQKYQELSGVLSVAEKYRAMAEDPKISKEENDHWRQLHTQTLSEADKIMNRKSSGIGSILKIFGFGKKQANGSVVTPPGEWYQAQGGEPPAGGEAPAAQSPLPDEMNMPANFRGIPPELYLGTPGSGSASVAPVAAASAPSEDKYANMNPIMAYNERLKDIETERRRQDAIATATETGTISQRFQRENSDWERTQKQAEIDRKVAAYKESPQYDAATEAERNRVLNDIQFDLPYREPQMRLKTEIARNEETGELVRRTTDLASNQVVSEEPYYNPADEPTIQAIIAQAEAEGKTMTPEEARVELGKVRLRGLNLSNQGRAGSIASQAITRQAATDRARILHEKANNGGVLTPAQAIGVHRSAMSYGRQMLAADPTNSITMTEAQKQQFINEHARQYVEGGQGQEGIMPWGELIRIMNPAAPAKKTPEEEARGWKPTAAPGKPAPAARTGSRVQLER